MKSLKLNFNNNLQLKTTLLLTGLLLIAPFSLSAAPTAREIMERVNNRDEGNNNTSLMEMILIDKNGHKRVRRMKSFSRDVGKVSQSLIFFLSPADVRNTGFLTYDYDAPGKDDDQWLYLPALQKAKRIAAGDKSGSFMGSDFNYSDMTSPVLDDYNYRLMGEPKVRGVKTWQIEAIPKNEKTAIETGYAKAVLWIRQDNLVGILSKRWVQGEKRQKYMQVVKLEQIDGIWVALEISMVTKEGKRKIHATRLKFSEVRFNQKMGKEMFTLRRLAKGL